MAQKPYLSPSDLTTYAPSVSVPPQIARALCERATALIIAHYGRGAEITPFTREIVSMTPDNRGHLANCPVIDLDSTAGDLVEARYGPGALPWGSMFGPPQWDSVPLAYVDINPTTGTIWVPSGLYNVPYMALRVTYRSGFCPVGGPYPDWLKHGTGKLIENIIVRSGTTQVQSAQVADQQRVQFFDQSLFDLEIEQLLNPLGQNLFG